MTDQAPWRCGDVDDLGHVCATVNAATRRHCDACGRERQAATDHDDARTIDVGYVHVLTEPGGPCVPTCPHPDHADD